EISPRRHWRAPCPWTVPGPGLEAPERALLCDGPGELVEAGEPVEHLQHAIFAEGPHPLASPLAADLLARGAAHEEPLDLLAHRQQLVDAHAALVAGAAAPGAARRPVDRHGIRQVARQRC